MDELKINIKAEDKVSRKIKTLCITAEEYVERARQVCWNIKTREQAEVALRFLDRTGKFLTENKRIKAVNPQACLMLLYGIELGLTTRWSIELTQPERNLS